GMYAARAWRLQAWMGKREGVYLLDCGLKAWHAAGLPMSLDAPIHEPGRYGGEPDMSMVLSGSRLHGRLGRPEKTLIDARSEAR
ncbi:sulfurtransferase, partial [Pseudomonas syringae pv. tagetis]